MNGTADARLEVTEAVPGTPGAFMQFPLPQERQGSMGAFSIYSGVTPFHLTLGPGSSLRLGVESSVVDATRGVTVVITGYLEDAPSTAPVRILPLNPPGRLQPKK